MDTIAFGIYLTLALGFGTMALGLVHKPYNLMSGLIWMFGGIFYFVEIHVGFTILSIGLGFILLIGTAVDYLDSERQKSIP